MSARQVPHGSGGPGGGTRPGRRGQSHDTTGGRVNTNTLPWTQACSLVTPALDDEHRALLDKVNRLLAAVSLGDETATLMAYSVLVAESRRHFAAEEERMRVLGYPDRDRHRAQHEKLQAGLAGLQFTLSNRPSFARSPGPLVYLDRWFAAHLQTDDRQLAAFIHERDAAAHARPTLRIVRPHVAGDAADGAAPVPPSPR
jgi:hemerythrin